ncbi:MAG: hypothetical protein RR549_03410, partial [Oscillospiraceae bacterium]
METNSINNEPNEQDIQTQNDEKKDILNIAQTKKKKHRKYKMSAPIGLCIILLGIVGLISLGVVGTNFAFSLTDNTAQKKEIEKAIAVVVNLDPVPFESIEKADSNVLLNSAVWYTLKASNKKDFLTNDEGSIMIPQSDIEVSFKKLYGKAMPVTHKSIQNIGEGTEYVYDEANKCYLIPTTGLIDSFIPQVTEITNENGNIVAKVGYVATDSEWGVDGNGNKVSPEPYKYMKYTLKKDDGYYIVA